MFTFMPFIENERSKKSMGHKTSYDIFNAKNLMHIFTRLFQPYIMQKYITEEKKLGLFLYKIIE